MRDEKEGGKREQKCLGARRVVWRDRGLRGIVHEEVAHTWKKYIREAPARESGRSGGGDGKPGPCCGGSSGRGTGEARGKYKKPETAVRAARAPKASLVAQSVSD